MRIHTEIQIEALAEDDRSYVYDVELSANIAAPSSPVDSYRIGSIRVVNGPPFIEHFDDLRACDQEDALAAFERAYENRRGAA